MKEYRGALDHLASMLRMQSQLLSHPSVETTQDELFRRICGQYAVIVDQQIDLVDAITGGHRP